MTVDHKILSNHWTYYDFIIALCTIILVLLVLCVWNSLELTAFDFSMRAFSSDTSVSMAAKVCRNSSMDSLISRFALYLDWCGNSKLRTLKISSKTVLKNSLKNYSALARVLYRPFLFLSLKNISRLKRIHQWIEL